MGYNVDNSFPAHPIFSDIRKELKCINKTLESQESGEGGITPPTVSEVLSFWANDIPEQEFTTIEVKKSPDCLSTVVVETSVGTFEIPTFIKSTTISLTLPFTILSVTVADDEVCDIETIHIIGINEQ